MPLTIPEIKNAHPREKAYKLSEEKGLYLLINPNGSKYWRYKYRFGGKEKLLAFGVYPDVSLKSARIGKEQAQEQLRNMIDPLAAKKERKRAEKIKTTNSFSAVAKEWWQHQQ